MTSTAQIVADIVRRTVSTVLADRGVIVVAGVLAAATPVVPLVRRLGARDVLVVALSTGTDDLPDPSLCTCLVTASARPAPTIDKEIRCWQEFVDSPPRDVHAAVDRFDPAGEAVVTVLIPVTLDDGYLARATYGGRPRGYTLLEDKTTNDTLLGGCGGGAGAVHRGPHRRDRPAFGRGGARCRPGNGMVGRRQRPLERRRRSGVVGPLGGARRGGHRCRAPLRPADADHALP